MTRMLIGAHVSPAGGLPQGGRARRRARLPRDPDLQPVAARCGGRPPTRDEDFAAFREAMRRQPDRGGADPRRLPAQLRQRGPRDPREVARVADALAARRRRDRRRRRRPAPRLGARPATSARRSRAPARRSARRWPRARAARCTSRTPPAPAARSGARSRSSRRCSRPAGGGERLGVCLDSCHLLASGYDIRTADGLGEVLDECDAQRRRWTRLGSLHLNDSQTPLGSNRDRHANVGDGRARRARAARRSCPSRGLQRLPCVLETPGDEPRRPDRARRSRCAMRAARARRSPRRALSAQAAAADGCRRGRRARRRAASSACDAWPSALLELRRSSRRRVLRRGRPSPSAHARAAPRRRVDLEHDLGRRRGSPRASA